MYPASGIDFCRGDAKNRSGRLLRHRVPCSPAPAKDTFPSGTGAASLIVLRTENAHDISLHHASSSRAGLRVSEKTPLS